MEENLFDGKHYITAQVIIKADDFAREMLGENPTPRQMEEFIRDNASMMECVYGSADIVPKGEAALNLRSSIQAIERKLDFVHCETEFVAKRVSEAIADELLNKKPWYKRLFSK